MSDIPVSKLVSGAFLQSLYVPFNFSFTCLHSFYLFPTSLRITCNLALGQEAVHSRVMSHEATQCARRCCSRSLADPGPLLRHGFVGLELHKCKLPYTLRMRAQYSFPCLCWRPLGFCAWILISRHVPINVWHHHKLPLDAVDRMTCTYTLYHTISHACTLMSYQ